MKKKFWMSLMMVASMIVAAGCGNNSGTGSESEGSGSTTGGGSEEKSYQIAISQIVEHPSLDATREGFIAALKDAGIEENKNLKIDYNNAQGDSTNILSIAQKISGDSKNDLVLGIATPSALA
ncbi:ABC transporter substrate binding protein, partial [Paenibacillus sp.]